MTDISIKIAVESNSSEISDFVCLHFNGFEPIQLFHVRSEDLMDPPPADLVRESIASKTTLIAYIEDKIVGVMIAGEITSDVADKDLEYAEIFGPKGVDVFELLSYVGEKAKVCDQLKIPKSLHIHILSVHCDHLRQGIGHKLFQYIIELGKRQKYPAISVDCTSFFTTKIAEKFDMKCISTVSYDEYNEHIGQKLFVPSEPHSEIKTYAKIYSNN